MLTSTPQVKQNGWMQIKLRDRKQKLQLKNLLAFFFFDWLNLGIFKSSLFKMKTFTATLKLAEALSLQERENIYCYFPRETHFFLSQENVRERNM